MATLLSESPAPEPEAASKSAAFGRVALLMAGTVIVLTLAGTFSAEKLQFLYKDSLHLSASGVASLGILLALPTYLRPFIGASSDLFPLFGYHRRSYYLLAILLEAAGFFALSLVTHPSYGTTALLVIVTAAGGAALMIVADALMVAVGNRTGTVPILQGIQQILPYALSFLALARLSGSVTQNWSYTRCFQVAALMMLLALPLTGLIDERRVTRDRRQSEETPEEHASRREAKAQKRAASLTILLDALKSPGLWAVVAYIFYLVLTPSGTTAQFFFEVDTLHFSKQFIGGLSQWSSAGVVLGIVTVALLARHLPVRVLVWAGWVIGTVTYLLNFALRDPLSAEIIFFVMGYFGVMSNLSLYTLAARAYPPGVEGTIYALFIAAIGLANTLSNAIGARLYDFYGPMHHHSAVSGWHAMSWWGFGLTVPAGLLILLMPAWSRSTQPLSAKPSLETI